MKKDRDSKWNWATNSEWESEWESDREAYMAFENENRRLRRSFHRRVERMLKESPNTRRAEEIATDGKRARNMKAIIAATDTTLQPAEFNQFMAIYHNQEQEVLKMEEFTPPVNLKEVIRNRIIQSARNQTEGIDGTHNEMLKVSPELSEHLLFEWWALMGSTLSYPN